VNQQHLHGVHPLSAGCIIKRISIGNAKQHPLHEYGMIIHVMVDCQVEATKFPQSSSNPPKYFFFLSAQPPHFIGRQSFCHASNKLDHMNHWFGWAAPTLALASMSDSSPSFCHKNRSKNRPTACSMCHHACMQCGVCR